MAKKVCELRDVNCKFGRLSFGAPSASVPVTISPAGTVPHALIDELTNSECETVLVLDTAGGKDVQGQQKLLPTEGARLGVLADISSVASTDRARSFTLSMGAKAMPDPDRLTLMRLAEQPGKITLKRIGDAPERRGRPKGASGDEGDGEPEA